MRNGKVAEHNYKVGDILSSSWGYSMTIVNYYQVVKTTPKMITVREIAGKLVSGDGMRGESVPVPNAFVPKKSYQPAEFHRLVVRGMISINESERAGLWDGEPMYHDHWD